MQKYSPHTSVANRVIMEQAEALRELAGQLPQDFDAVTALILNCKGRVVVSGIGKSGYIAHKIAASFSSTGTAALYIHPSEASHGDLGMITESDVVIMLSNSGDTKELTDILNYCKRFGVPVVGITMRLNSMLGKYSDFVFCMPQQKEASAIAAPTTSAVMMLSLGDALMVAVQEARGFSADDFKIYHPGGKIGANLLKVVDLMRQGEQVPVIKRDTSFIDAIITMTSKTLGCAVVVDANDVVIGIVTDGDLRRHMNEIAMVKSAEDIMTANPQSVNASELASAALHIMNENAITVLPVVDENDKLIGVLHIHDLLKAGV